MLKQNPFKLSLHNFFTIILHTLTLYIIISTLFNCSSLVLNELDYLFLIILLISFVLIKNLNIKLNDSIYSFIDFNDYILTIVYFIFKIHLIPLFILVGNVIMFAFNYKYNKKFSIKKGLDQIFNTSLIITSIFLADKTLKLVYSNFEISTYKIISIILFSILLILFNYVIFCIDVSIQSKKLFLITLENGLYNLLLSYIFCLILSLISLVLYDYFNYTPVVLTILFLLFTTSSLKKNEKYKKKNKCLNIISNSITEIISKGNLKIKYFSLIKSIEQILPFSYCGMYFFRDNCELIYPTVYKNNLNINPETLSIAINSNSNIYSTLHIDKAVYTINESVIQSMGFDLQNIDSLLIIPIKGQEKLHGCITIALNHLNNIDEEIPLLSILGKQIGLVHDNVYDLIHENMIPFTKYNDLLTHMDYNIKYKIMYTLAIIEISNYKKIISEYNLDFYESLKKDISSQMIKFLSPYDTILYSEKEDIYIEFVMSDSKNTSIKLNTICEHFKNYNYKNIPIDISLTYSTSEYPKDGLSKEEILEIAHRKLYKMKHT